MRWLIVCYVIGVVTGFLFSTAEVTVTHIPAPTECNHVVTDSLAVENNRMLKVIYPEFQKAGVDE